MLTDIFRVIGQLGDPRLLKPVLASLLVSAIVLVGLVAFSYWLLGSFAPSGEGAGWLGDIAAEWGLVEILGSFAVGWLALLLFPAVALTIQGLFVDQVADAVEAKHYANTPPARDVPIFEAIWASLKLTLVVLVLNLILLPLYLILMLIPPTGLVLYLAVNGYLVGREYFETVGLRRLTLQEAKMTRRRNRMSVWMDGVLLVFLFTIPILNLAGPTLGTAYMVHRFHRIW